ncbi:hypothetical protein [Streptomyces sp. NPDC003952]
MRLSAAQVWCGASRTWRIAVSGEAWARAVVRAAEAGRVGLRGLERAGGDVLSGLEA